MAEKPGRMAGKKYENRGLIPQQFPQFVCGGLAEGNLGFLCVVEDDGKAISSIGHNHLDAL
jgi:hypothetical protein